MKLSINKFFGTCILSIGLFVSATVNAQVVSPASIVIDNNQLKAKLALSSAIEVDLTLQFDKAIGLTANNFDISAELISPTDLTILNRLPSALTSAVSGFPVLVSVSPKADKGFAFEGVATVELYTKAIHYTPNIPWKLFTSHDGGTFEDITTITSSGSFRARGSTGRFSDFIILLDSRAASVVISDKANNISQTIADNRSSMGLPLQTLLDAGMSDLTMSLASLNYTSALTEVDSLITVVENSSADELANVWRSSDDIVNVKGSLLSQLYTLRYSLRIL